METSSKILSDLIVYMKYAKYSPDKGRREVWSEITDRNRKMHLKKFPELTDEINKAYEFVYDKKVLPSMRSMQFGGKPIEINPSRINNCAYLPVDTVDAFSETMFLLLGGTGVGYSVQTHHINKLPEITGLHPTKTKRFLISDSIEGWADAIKMLFKGYTTNGPRIRFDFSDIRQKGAALVTSGGKAPGPQPLKECLIKIEGVLEQATRTRRLTSVQSHDILCHIADAVLSGGIRRAAMICFFSIKDTAMLTCKAGAWWEANPQRGRANNSAVIVRSRIKKEDFDKIFEYTKVSGSGEPGLYFTNDKDMLTNPCFSGTTRILTTDGYKQFKDLVGKDDLKLIGDDFKPYKGRVVHSGHKETVRIFLNNGTTIDATPDHVFKTAKHRLVKAKFLMGLILCTPSKGSKNIGRRGLPKVMKVANLGAQDVYDFTIGTKKHLGVVEGVLAHNCGEIALKPFSFCNLTEINASTITSQEDLNERAKTAAFIATLQATYTDFHYLRDEWKTATELDALIGVSLTGIASNSLNKLDLGEAAKCAIETNKKLASQLGINPAKRVTTIKPAGTSSIVLGCSSGIHAWHAKYYIRRIRINKTETIYKYLNKHHSNLLEDDFMSPHDTSVLSVPQKAPLNAVLRDEPIIDFLERVSFFFNNWVLNGHTDGPNTNNVSATVSVKEDEWETIKKWLWKNKNNFNGISMLPFNGGTYKQAPFEECSKYMYDKLMESLSEVNFAKIKEEEDNTNLSGELACGGGSCEVR